MHPSALWYASRATGAVSLLLLTLVGLLGVVGTFRWRSRTLPKFLVHGLHRNVTMVAVAFLAVHVGTAVLDPYAPIRIVDAVVPLASSYRPVWLGLGAVAFDLLLALTVSSLLRARIGARLWRGIHWLAYAAWPVAVVHGLGTGTDVRTGWLELLTAGCTAAVVAAVVVRAARALGRNRDVALGGLGATALLPVVVLAWALHGPLAPGWARKAGTPAALLGGGRALPPAGETQTALLPSPPFGGRFAGSIGQSGSGDGRLKVSIRARTTSGPHAVVRIDLVGEPAPGGGVVLTASSATLGTARALDEYTGSIAALDGDRMLVDMRSATGDPLQLGLAVQIDGSRVTGVLHAGTSGDPE